MPPGLTLHTSNRLEALSEQLAEVLALPLASPLTTEIVVVQSNGMRRWLTQQLAQSHGICANIDFPFPQRFFRELFAQVFPSTILSEIYERAPMAWRIFQLLPKLAERPEFRPIAKYLAGERAELRRYQLARRIAAVFERYLTFRPELVVRWDAGELDDWQSTLWSEIQSAAPGEHQVARGRRLTETLHRAQILPERISIFGLSS